MGKLVLVSFFNQLGKTHTMFGVDWETFSGEQKKISQMQSTFLANPETDENMVGLIPRSLNEIFSQMKTRSSKFNIYCSFLQIYNEKIFDLLQDSNLGKELKIHESKEDGVYVGFICGNNLEGLTEYSVGSYIDCCHLLRRGESNRAVRSTYMNAKSSRSHTIYQILFESAQADKSGKLYVRIFF